MNLPSILFGFFLCLLFVPVSYYQIQDDDSSKKEKKPAEPQIVYAFQKPTTAASSEPVAKLSKDELLVRCKQEYDLAKTVMEHRQIKVSPTKSLELIYKDPKLPSDLKDLAKNAVVMVQDSDTYLIQANRVQAIQAFAEATRTACLKYN